MISDPCGIGESDRSDAREGDNNAAVVEAVKGTVPLGDGVDDSITFGPGAGDSSSADAPAAIAGPCCDETQVSGDGVSVVAQASSQSDAVSDVKRETQSCVGADTSSIENQTLAAPSESVPEAGLAVASTAGRDSAVVASLAPNAASDQAAADSSSAASGAPKPRAEARSFPGYTMGLSASGDEWFDVSGRTRAGLEAFVEPLAAMSPQARDRLAWNVRQRVDDAGITYHVYQDPHGSRRAWPLDALPAVLDESEWSQIEAGVAQRAALLDAILGDLYGPQTLLREGLVPARFLHRLGSWLAPVARRPRDAKAPFPSLWFYAADLVRGPDGRFWVMGDRTQAPSGAAYADQNRTVTRALWPEAGMRLQPRSLEPGFGDWVLGLRAALQSLPDAPPDACAVLLSPGPLNESWFEHVQLARRLGLQLVQGEDLVFHEGRIWLRGLERLVPVGVILRRVDDDWSDPLFLRPDSMLGVAGLLEAEKRGRVRVLNALGSGVLEAPGWQGFLSRIATEWWGEPLQLPGVASWWCGQPESLALVLDTLERLVIRRIDRAGGGDPVFVAQLDPKQVDTLIDELRRAPDRFVAQEALSLSTFPTLIDGGGIEPRRGTLRVFAGRRSGARQSVAMANTCRDGGPSTFQPTAAAAAWSVLPTALTRVAGRRDSCVVSNQAGGLSKDAWVCRMPARDTGVAALPTPHLADQKHKAADTGASGAPLCASAGVDQSGGDGDRSAADGSVAIGTQGGEVLPVAPAERVDSADQFRLVDRIKSVEPGIDGNAEARRDVTANGGGSEGASGDGFGSPPRQQAGPASLADPESSGGWAEGPQGRSQLSAATDRPTLGRGMPFGQHDLPRRVAERFYWLGRYAERLESLVRWLRLLRHRAERLPPTGWLQAHGYGSDSAPWFDETGDAELDVLLDATAWIAGRPLPVEKTWDGPDAAALGAGAMAPMILPVRACLAQVFGVWGAAAVRELLDRVESNHHALRDRLSGDTLHVLQRLHEHVLRLSAMLAPAEPVGMADDSEPGFGRTAASAAGGHAVPGETSLEDALDSGRLFRIERALGALAESLAAFAGLSQENLVHHLGWRFLDAGRRIERSRNLLRLMSLVGRVSERAGAENTDAEHSRADNAKFESMGAKKASAINARLVLRDHVVRFAESVAAVRPALWQASIVSEGSRSSFDSVAHWRAAAPFSADGDSTRSAGGAGAVEGGVAMAGGGGLLERESVHDGLDAVIFDRLLRDPENPRGLLFQLERLAEHARAWPGRQGCLAGWSALETEVEWLRVRLRSGGLRGVRSCADSDAMNGVLAAMQSQALSTDSISILALLGDVDRLHAVLEEQFLAPVPSHPVLGEVGGGA
ncbi:MAG: circularly permuted type 2 ATP-grasp protein [Thioalkalivibrionaceae bacterium]